MKSIYLSKRIKNLLDKKNLNGKNMKKSKNTYLDINQSE